MDQHLRKQERPLLNKIAATGVVEFRNEKPFMHTAHFGTTLEAERSDFKTGVTLTCPPGISDEHLVSDVMEIAAWHAIHIHPRLNGFQGYDCVRISLKKFYERRAK